MIRRAGPEDVDAVAEVFGRSFGSLTFLPRLHTAEENRAFFARVLAGDEVWTPTTPAAGIGSALPAHVKSTRRGGFDLWTFQDNAGARRFYERYGCRPVEFTDGAGNEEKTPDLRYVWP